MDTDEPKINIGRLRTFLGHVHDLYRFTNSAQVDEGAADLVRDKMEAQWEHLSQAERDMATALSATLDVLAEKLGAVGDALKKVAKDAKA